MPSVTRKSVRDRESRREELLGSLIAALEFELAAGRAYMDISVAQLVASAGIGRSTFYSYFSDMSGIVHQWFLRTRSDLHVGSSTWWQLGVGLSPAELRAALAELVQTYRPVGHMMAAVYEAAAYDPNVRLEVDQLMDENIAALRQHIEVGQREGFVDADLEPFETASWLMWMAERTMHRLVLRPEASDAERELHIDSFTRIVWRTLYAPARPT